MTPSPPLPRRFPGDWTVLEQSVSLPLHLHSRLCRQIQRTTSEAVSNSDLRHSAPGRICCRVHPSGGWKTRAFALIACGRDDSVIRKAVDSLCERGHAGGRTAADRPDVIVRQSDSDTVTDFVGRWVFASLSGVRTGSNPDTHPEISGKTESQIGGVIEG